jgi:hypothetical protein
MLLNRVGGLDRLVDTIRIVYSSFQDNTTAINHVLDKLTDPDDFLSKIQELYQNPLEFSFDVLRFKDGRIFERYSPAETRGYGCREGMEFS